MTTAKSAKLGKITRYHYQDEQFLMDYTHKQGPFDMKIDHVHDDYEVYYLLSGQRRYFISNRIYTIEKGDLVLIPKYTLHRTLRGEGTYHQRLVFNFTDLFLAESWSSQSTFNLLRPFQKKVPTLRLRDDDRRYLEALFYRAIAELKEQAPGSDLALKAITLEALVHIARCSDKYEEAEISFETPLHQKISEIARYVQNHYAEPLTLARLSETFYISTYYLSRTFKEITGFTFIEFLNYTRMKEAQRLLRETNWTVLKIAEEVGYSYGTHFGRVFKQMTHLSPIQYRRMQQGSK